MDSQEQEAIAQAILAAQALGQYHNEQTAVYFTLAMSGMAAIFIVLHWANCALSEPLSKSTNFHVRRALHMTRSLRSVLLRKVQFFPSFGHAVIFLAYLAINITLCFRNIDWSTMFDFAARLGWMAVCNIALITFLALKNTPLACLTAFSYERLNCLHQAAGYCTVAFALTHPIVTVVAYSSQTRLAELLEAANIMGMVAGCSIFLILISASLVRKQIYEIFYVIHVSLFILILVAVSIHRSDITLKSLIIVLVAAFMWTSDRSIRFARIAWRAYGSNASLRPLALGGIRIVTNLPLRHAVPGCHVFLWIPNIRATEAHPFTIVSMNPLELVIKAHNGFTRDLLAYSSKHRDALLKASIDGPYGTLPDFSSFGQVILIAGGIGASFTFGVALGVINKVGDSIQRPLINFIWVVRKQETLTCFTKELENLYASPLVQLTIHVTASGAASTIPRAATLDVGAVVQDKAQCDILVTEALDCGTNPACDSDVEKSALLTTTQPFSQLQGAEIHSGRPNIANLIPSMVGGVKNSESTIVAVCGPQSLMLATRSVVAGIVRDGDKNVTLHCEQFGW